MADERLQFHEMGLDDRVLKVTNLKTAGYKCLINLWRNVEERNRGGVDLNTRFIFMILRYNNRL